MRTKAFVVGAILSMLCVAAVQAADVNGKWLSEYTTPDGTTRQNTFVFAVKGDTLTGTVASTRGESPIQNGIVRGDTVSFTVIRNFGGNEMKFQYKGKVAGDGMALTVTVGEGDRTFEMIAKRVK